MTVHSSVMTLLQAASWSPPTSYTTVVHTDPDGNFEAGFKGSQYVQVYPYPEGERFRSYSTTEERIFSQSDYTIHELLKTNSRTNPLLIYQEPERNRNVLRTTSAHSAGATPNNTPFDDCYSFPGSRGRECGGPKDTRNHLRVSYSIDWDVDDPSWVIKLASIRGGVIGVPTSDLPFSSNVPTVGYVESAVIRVPLVAEDTPPTKHAFYIKAQNGEVYGTIVMEVALLSLETAWANNIQLENDTSILKVNILADMIVRTREIKTIEHPYLPQRVCGGSMSMNHDGFYAKLPTYDRQATNDSVVSASMVRERLALRPIIEFAKNNADSAWLANPKYIDDQRIAEAALSNPRLDSNAISSIYAQQKGRYGSDRIIREIARNSLTPTEILRDISTADTKKVFSADLALNKNTPLTLSAKDVHKMQEYEQFKLATSLTLKPELANILADSPAKTIRFLVAYNPATPTEVLEKMSKTEKDPDVLAGIAWNTHTPGYVLRELAKSKNERIRFPTAYNVSTPADALEILSHDSSVNLRQRVFCNPANHEPWKATMDTRGFYKCMPDYDGRSGQEGSYHSP